MTLPIVGREPELARVDRLLQADTGTLLLEGSPGIGKTTVWRHAVEAARERGLLVLVAEPAEPEAALPYAALGDLLRPLEARIAALPPSLGSALEVALRLRTWNGQPDELAVARGTLDLVTADERPLLIAVDDAQWLDRASERALAFVLRRIAGRATRVLVAIRSDHALPGDLGRVLGRMAHETLELGPLGATELDRLLRLRLDVRLPRPTLVRLARITGGNPLYALQVAGTYDARTRELAIPETLGDALHARIADAPAAAQAMVLLAASCLQPTAGTLERTSAGVRGLRAAVDLGLLEVHGDRVRFSHPLLAAVTLDRALPGELRAAHRELATVTNDPVERSLHLARGADEADEALAAALESAASLAAVRAMPDLAAEVAEASMRLTPTGAPDRTRRRLTAAAEFHVAAGDPERGRALLEREVRELEPGPERAALLWRLADTIGDSIEEPIRLCEQALAEAGDDPGLRGEIHTALGVFTWIAGDLESATQHCRQAVHFAELAGDEERLAVAIGEMCHAEAILGVPWDRAAMERALALESRIESLPASLSPSFQLAVISLVTDDLDTARPLLENELERARQAGDEPAVFHALFRVAELELRAGHWADALRAAREADALTRQGGIEQEQATTSMALGLVLAHLGQHEQASERALFAHRVADAGGDRAVAIRSVGVLGFVALSSGDPSGALTWLTPAREELESMGTGELSISGIVQNEIEALVSVGGLDEAEEVIRFVERNAERSGRLWHRVVAARGRALVASARGEPDEARRRIAEALAAHKGLPQPFELARTLLAAGQVERRFKARGAARDALGRALELFDELGAAVWAERAAAELARVSGRARSGTDLTETERRVAELAATGLPNKEIAARLFVTVRTVEANLTKVYAKLGVRSRTELASTRRR